MLQRLTVAQIARIGNSRGDEGREGGYPGQFCEGCPRSVPARRLPLPPKNTYEWQTQELMRKTGEAERGTEVEELTEVKERASINNRCYHISTNCQMITSKWFVCCGLAGCQFGLAGGGGTCGIT
ncbi:MAG: hypothetical protein NVS9B13_07410 [Candidatus Acidiferrum sp.]